jgi:predicted GNAT family N-acyltransferase
VVLREIGRLREQTFRLVGEGTGSRRDLDKYDHYYRHLVLWDEEKLCIAGAYRLGEAHKLMKKKGANALYTAELFDFHSSLTPYLEQGLELGRSFVHPDYWGKASLDYLWQGLGAYLSHHPQVRYVFGPVSMSAHYPKALRDLLVFYYERYYLKNDDGLKNEDSLKSEYGLKNDNSNEGNLAEGKHPHEIDEDVLIDLQHRFAKLDSEQGFIVLQEEFKKHDCKIPVLFKQYAGLYEEGGYNLLAFSVDSEFGNCVDGLFMGDLTCMKPAKRARYLPTQDQSADALESVAAEKKSLG